MPIQGLNFVIPTNQERHQSYQATGSFIVYNPNDGVCFVATDRTANTVSWDYKIPSQSGGKFPGPINSYLSIYFQDQSGSASTGQVVVYASTDKMDIPHFWSIGRALLAAGSTLDINTGTLPTNPPANTVRLWADGNGDLHVLNSSGVDDTVLDTGNYNTLISMIGDARGPLSNTTVDIRNNSAIFIRDSGNTRRNLLTLGSEQLFWDGTAGGFRWVNQGNTVQYMALSSPGNLTVAGTITSGSTIFAGGGSNSPGAWLTMPPRIGPQLCLYDAGAGSFFGLGINSAELSLIGQGFGFRVLANNGTRIAFIDAAGSMLINGNFQTAGSTSPVNSGDIVMGGASSTFYFHPNLTVGLRQSAPWMDVLGFGIRNNANNGILSGVGFWAVVGGSNNNGQSFFCAGGAGGPTGWQIISTERFKSDIVLIEDALSIVLEPSLHGIHYTKTIPPEILHGIPADKNSMDTLPDGPLKIIDPQPEYGFIAEPWSQIAPDVVFFNEEGNAHMMDYGQVTAILFEAFKQYVEKTDARLSALELAA